MFINGLVPNVEGGRRTGPGRVGWQLAAEVRGALRIPQPVGVSRLELCRLCRIQEASGQADTVAAWAACRRRQGAGADIACIARCRGFCSADPSWPVHFSE